MCGPPEWRIAGGLNPALASVTSLVVSRSDRAVADKVPVPLRNRLGIPIAKRTYRESCALFESAPWQRALNDGARLQRLLWASMGTKDSAISGVLYVESLAPPFTINTMPGSTPAAFADHGVVTSLLSPDGGDCGKTLAQFAYVGIGVGAHAMRLQEEGAGALAASWNEFLAVISNKGAALRDDGSGAPRRKVRT